MIGRLAHLAWGMVLYFALATLIAEGIMAGYLYSAGRLDPEALGRIVAILSGVAPAQTAPSGDASEPQAPAEHPSYEQILEARALKDKNLQLRELALANALAQLKIDQRRLAEDEKRYRQQQADHEARLAAAAQSAKAAGRQEVRRILETVRPKQAKEIVAGMLEAREEDEVVLLLSGMNESKRAKILGEFKTPEEINKVEAILRRIRLGVPEAAAAGQQPHPSLTTPQGAP
ncbi:MAG: hypothetical protein ACUVUC_08675 [Thermoguttaceae bacterium]